LAMDLEREEEIDCVGGEKIDIRMEFEIIH
jgi:hypothetical protein